MSVNQSRAEKNEVQYRKIGSGGARSNNSSAGNQHKNFSASSRAAASSAHRSSFKKFSNAQGGQSRENYASVNASLNNDPAYEARFIENGGHVQSTIHGESTLSASADTSTQKSNDNISSDTSAQQSASMTSDSTLPSPPPKEEVGKGFPLQFGSISPNLMNGMQVPPRTSSAPPNFDEQKPEQQIQNDALRSMPESPLQSAPRQQVSAKDVAVNDQQHPVKQDQPHVDSKMRRDIQLTSLPPIPAQKSSILPMAGMPMPIPFHQPPIPMQFGGHNPQIQSQGMLPGAPLQMPMQMPLQMGNPPQVQQPVFMPGLQHHLMQTPGIMHQGQGLGFNPQLGPQLPHQPGSLGLNMPQFNQQQAIKFGSIRKSVKITHPETREELKLDNRDGGSLGSRAHHSGPPHTQPVPTFTPTHPVGYYPNSYRPFLSAPTSHPLPGTHLPTNSPAPMFNYPVGQAPPSSSFMNQSSNSRHGSIGSSNFEFARDVQSISPPAQSKSTYVKVSSGSITESAAESQMLRPNVEARSIKDSEASANGSSPDSQQSSLEPISGPLNGNVMKKEIVSDSESAEDAQRQSGKQRQLQNYDSSRDVATDATEAKITHTSSTVGEGVDLGTENKTVQDQDSKQNGHSQLDNSMLDSEAGQFTEGARPNSSSGSNKTYTERNKTKNNSGKKKRKEMLQKADALGTTSDLYMAYKGPNENTKAIATAPDASDSVLKGHPSDARPTNSPRKKKDEQNKAELEDWEDAADDSMPKLESPGKGSYGSMHKYSRDFLLTFSQQCVELPEGFQIAPDIVDVLICVDMKGPHDREYLGPGKGIDRSFGSSRPDRHGNGMMDMDRWGRFLGPHPSSRDPSLDLVYGNPMMGFRADPGVNYGVLRNMRGQGPIQHVGGILSGPMHSMGYQGMQRNNPDVDRWQRATNFNKGLMPSPQTPLQAMHRAERKYEVGKVTDEEQAKQRRLKAILNKLTPQNFEKLFEQVKEVNIDNAVTLTGVISQIFDKALTEPTFCEMYANFCSHLAMELPDLSVDNEKITFRRLLLNKCQEEFERGEREEEEANKANGEGETKQSEEEREEKRLKARRRMLGNIRLIGELYKKKMLTERIMHECIKKLLGQYQNPDEENIEALCKLMSTIGEMIDHPKAKEHMDAYFDIMGQLSNNMKLSSRVRFMLKDSIDLRKNKWQQRRKVEGPKKIEEVHRDAAQERQGQAGRLNRGQGMNSVGRRGQTLEYAPRGSMLSSQAGQGGFRGMPTQARAYVAQDVRMDDRVGFESRTLSVPLPQRSSGDEPITLGPQGGLAKGMAFRGPPAPSTDTSSYRDPRRTVAGPNGHSNIPNRGVDGAREDQFTRDFRNPDRSVDWSMPQTEQVRAPPPQPGSSEKVRPEERLRDMSIAAIKEYYSAKDEKEVALCIKDLNAPSFYPTVISIWVSDAFERKDKERGMLAELLVTLTKPSEGIFNANQLIHGFESVLASLEDAVNDAPKAPEFLGQICSKLILEKVIPLKEVGRLIHEGGEEPGRLLEAGLAADVLGSILEAIKLDKGDSVLNEIRNSSGLRLEDFRSPDSAIRSKKLEMFM